MEIAVVPVPQAVCGCPVDRVLTADQSWLAIGPAGRGVVVKRIDRDCLLHGQLHPHVRDRLGRVRELAHPGVANLFGVEREGAEAYLIWEFVEGVSFDEYAATPGRTPADLAAVARELVLAVDLLHVQGIVHGALIPSNVFISPGGVVRLTHISPLLYTDKAVDVESVLNILEAAAESRGAEGRDLAAVVGDARQARVGLRQLATRLGALLGPRDAKTPGAAQAQPGGLERRRALLAALFVAIQGLAIAAGVWRGGLW